MTRENDAARRGALYALLGRLPERDAPVTCRVVYVQERGNYRLERLVLTVHAADPDAPRCEAMPA